MDWIELVDFSASIGKNIHLMFVYTFDENQIIPYIYVALPWVLKALYIEGGGGWSPHPPSVYSIHLDDATAAILRQNQCWGQCITSNNITFFQVTSKVMHYFLIYKKISELLFSHLSIN